MWEGLNPYWLLINGTVIFLLQVGLGMYYAAYQPGEQRKILTQTMTTVLIAAVAFWGIGYVLAFGNSLNGVIGLPTQDIRPFSLSSPPVDNYNDNANYFFFTIQIAAVASIALSGALGSAWQQRPRVITLVIFNALVLPIPMHWIWGAGGWLFDSGYDDYAGAVVIFTVVAGILAGVRVVTAPDKRKTAAPHDPVNTWIVAGLILLGWYGLNVGSTLDTTDPMIIGQIALNTTLAAIGGIAGAWLMQPKGGDSNPMTLVDGLIVGLVSSTGSCGFVPVWAAFIIAGVASMGLFNLWIRPEINLSRRMVLIFGGGALASQLGIGLFGDPRLIWSIHAGLFYSDGFFALFWHGMIWACVFIYGMTAAFILSTAGLMGDPAHDNTPQKRKNKTAG